MIGIRPKLTPIQVLERLQRRIEKRMESLQRVKLSGFDAVIAELEVELDLLRRVGFGGSRFGGSINLTASVIEAPCASMSIASWALGSPCSTALASFIRFSTVRRLCPVFAATTSLVLGPRLSGLEVVCLSVGTTVVPAG